MRLTVVINLQVVIVSSVRVHVHWYYSNYHNSDIHCDSVNAKCSGSLIAKWVEIYCTVTATESLMTATWLTVKMNW